MQCHFRHGDTAHKVLRGSREEPGQCGAGGMPLSLPDIAETRSARDWSLGSPRWRPSRERRAFPVAGHAPRTCSCTMSLGGADWPNSLTGAGWPPTVPSPPLRDLVPPRTRRGPALARLPFVPAPFFLGGPLQQSSFPFHPRIPLPSPDSNCALTDLDSRSLRKSGVRIAPRTIVSSFTTKPPSPFAGSACPPPLSSRHVSQLQPGRGRPFDGTHIQPA